MKILAELTDQNVLGLPGLSSAEPRLTARGILRRSDGLYAVMYSSRFNLYSLPGGGVDEGESIENALHREIAEETGCQYINLEPLGIVRENRAHADYTQLSYYFVATTSGTPNAQSLTPTEQANGTQVQWHTLAETLHLIGDTKHKTNQQKFLQARDMAALQAYMNKGDASEK